MKKLVFLIIIAFISASACTKLDSESPQPLPTNNLGKGFFVLNQGNFTSGNASLSFFNEDSAKMTNNVFFKRNNSPLGDVAHSITFWKGEAYIVVNNSAYIYVINASSGVFKRKITELQSPRYIQMVDAEKAYVSDLQLKGLFVFNPMTMQPLGVIETGKTTEAMALLNNEVFVTNWSEYNQTQPNNTVQIIDVNLDQLVDSIVVAKEPNSIVVDQNNKIWVLCSGGYLNEEFPALFRIDPESRMIEKRFNFPVLESSPEQLHINAQGDRLFYINEDVFSLSIQDENLPSTPLIAAEGRNYFAMGIHPEDEQIIVTDAGNYVQNGWVYRFRSDGMLIDSLQAGIIPGFIGHN